ncbi:M61 family metallopeptidase [Salinisphaera sp. LB1]|uniref:M61 family metallopeptidase n=1 Tax=Salinisphaera sp. LB1 TaxID=2183911 RepID=UPI000D705471|nr:PDZ domain-containing protein [Salinisphaera sp. LB1]
MSTLNYIVTPVDPAAHRLRVTLQLSMAAAEAPTLHLPTWIPGSYLIRDFARHLLAIEAVDAADGRPIAVVALDRSSWQLAEAVERVCVTCEFYARDASVRAAYLDDMRGFINFSSLALRPAGHEHAPVKVHLARPPARYDWSLVTTLQPAEVDERRFGHYQAANYWDLIDQPVAMGEAIETVPYRVRGVAHAFVLLGAHDADTRQLAIDLAAVCNAQADVFDELPAERYLFLAQVTDAGFGGLEHRDSSVLQVPRNALPSAARVASTGKRDPAYENLLGLASHEYFHLWNVKRIRPAAVAGSDLTGEAYFRDLWAYEGVTSYYDDLGLVRAGVINEQGYLDRLAKLATRIERTPGRHRQSLAQSSFDAWLKFYRPDENTPNAVVSYYGKGAQLALGLDLKIRLETEGRVSLDTVMQAAWQRYGRDDRPVPENALASLAAEVSGLDLVDFFDFHLQTTADAPWADYLGDFGIRALAEPATDDASIVRGRMGLILSEGPARIMHVLDNGPAQAAGISPGDRLIAFDGIEVGRELARQLARYPAGAALRVHLFRGDQLLVREMALAGDAAPEWHLSIDKTADEAAHARRAAWLHREPGDS